MAGLFPDGGVSYELTTGAGDFTASLQAGCSALFYRIDNCGQRFNPIQANSQITELLNLMTEFCPAYDYDCNRLDNLKQAFSEYDQKIRADFPDVSGITDLQNELQEKCDLIDALQASLAALVARVTALENAGGGGTGGGNTRTDQEILDLVCDNVSDLITTQPNPTRINILTTGQDGKLSAELDDGGGN